MDRVEPFVDSFCADVRELPSFHLESTGNLFRRPACLHFSDDELLKIGTFTHFHPLVLAVAASDPRFHFCLSWIVDATNVVAFDLTTHTCLRASKFTSNIAMGIFLFQENADLQPFGRGEVMMSHMGEGRTSPQVMHFKGQRGGGIRRERQDGCSEQ